MPRYARLTREELDRVSSLMHIVLSELSLPVSGVADLTLYVCGSSGAPRQVVDVVFRYVLYSRHWQEGKEGWGQVKSSCGRGVIDNGYL
jgi:hypothetical protein